MSSRKINIRSANSKVNSKSKKVNSKKKKKTSIDDEDDDDDDDDQSDVSDESLTSSEEDNSSESEASESSSDGDDVRRKRPKTMQSAQSKKGNKKDQMLDKFDNSFSKKRMVSSSKLIREPKSQQNLGYQASSLRVIPQIGNEGNAAPARSRRRSQSVKLDKPFPSKGHLSDLEEVNLSSEESPKKQRNNNYYGNHNTFDQSSRVQTSISAKLIPTNASLVATQPHVDQRKKLFSSTIIAGQIVEGWGEMMEMQSDIKEKKQQALLKLREANSRPDLSIWDEANAFKDTDMVIENQTSYIYSSIGSILNSIEQPIQFSLERQQNDSDPTGLSSHSSRASRQIHSIRSNPSLGSRLIRWISENHLMNSYHKPIMSDHFRCYFEGKIMDWNCLFILMIAFLPLMYDQGRSISFSEKTSSDLLVSSSQFTYADAEDEVIALKIIGCFSVFFVVFAILTLIRVHLNEEKKIKLMKSPFGQLIFKRIPWRALNKETVIYQVNSEKELANHMIIEYFSKRESNLFSTSSFLLIGIRVILSIAVIISANIAPILIQQTIYSQEGDYNRNLKALLTGVLIHISSYLWIFILTLILKLTKSVVGNHHKWYCIAVEAIISLPVLIYLVLHIEMVETSDSSFYWLTRNEIDFPCVANQFEFAVVGLYAGSILVQILKILVILVVFRRRSVSLNMQIGISMQSQQIFLVLCSGFVSFFALPVGVVLGFLMIQFERITVNRIRVDVKNGLPQTTIPICFRLIGVVLFATALMRVDASLQANAGCGIYSDGGIGRRISGMIEKNSIANTVYAIFTSVPFSFVLFVGVIAWNQCSRKNSYSEQLPDVRSVLHAGRQEGNKRAELYEEKLEYVHGQLQKIVPRSMREVRLPKQIGSSSNDHIVITQHEDDFNIVKQNQNNRLPIEASFSQAPPRNTPNASVFQNPSIQSSSAKARQNYFKNHQGKTASSWRVDYQQDEHKKSSDELSLQNHSPLLKQDYTLDDSRLLQKTQMNKSAFNYSFK